MGNLSAKAVLSGTGVGVITCFILIGVLFANDGKYDPFPFVDKIWSTLIGVALNVIVSWIAHCFIFPPDNGDNGISSPAGKGNDSEGTLSLTKIRKIMHGISEPATKWKGILVWLTMILSLMMVIHWPGEIDKELVEEFGRDYAEQLMYNGEIRNVIGGVPDYFLYSTFWLAAAIITGIMATLTWDVDINEDIDTPTKAKHFPVDSREDDSIAGDTRTVTIKEKQTELTSM